MNELIEKLKKLPIWAWWAMGGTTLVVAFLAYRARQFDAPATLGAPAPERSYGPSPAPAAPAGPSAVGNRDPDRDGDTESWLRSALGGLLDRSAKLELEVAQLRLGLASEQGIGMGTGPNRGSVSLPSELGSTARKVSIAAGIPLTSEQFAHLKTQIDSGIPLSAAAAPSFWQPVGGVMIGVNPDGQTVFAGADQSQAALQARHDVAIGKLQAHIATTGETFEQFMVAAPNSYLATEYLRTKANLQPAKGGN